MSNLFTVSMYNVGTVPLEQASTKDASVKTEHFNDESKALEFAATYKDKYHNVTVKNHVGQVIVKYHDGTEV